MTGTYGCDEPGRLELQIVRLPYDIERAIADATRAGSSELAEYADELRTAQYRGLKRLLANKQG